MIISQYEYPRECSALDRSSDLKLSMQVTEEALQLQAVFIPGSLLTGYVVHKSPQCLQLRTTNACTSVYV